MSFGLVAFYLTDAQTRDILAPVLAAIVGCVYFYLKITESTKRNPFTDLGVITMLSMLCYTIIPPLQYLLNGMEYNVNSAHQVYVLAPSSQELGSFTFWYVIYQRRC